MLKTSPIDKIALCASYCAYFVNNKGKFSPVPGSPFLTHANFITTPTAISAGEGKINAAIYGETHNYNVLAFRGTTQRICDWLQDADMTPVSVEGLPGKVYGGMYEAYESLKVQLAVALKKFQNNGKPLLITGHSKGGPMATYAAYTAKTKLNIPTHCVTFASPHPGDAGFARGYSSAGISHHRYENYQDAVPFIPLEDRSDNTLLFIIFFLEAAIEKLPNGSLKTDVEKLLHFIQEMLKNAATWNYQPVGELFYINHNYQVANDVSYAYRIQKVYDVFEEIDPISIFETFAYAHFLRRGSGYQKGVYPDLFPST